MVAGHGPVERARQAGRFLRCVSSRGCLPSLPSRCGAAVPLLQGIVEGAGRLAVNVGTVALLGFGGMLVIQDRISVGALLAGGAGLFAMRGKLWGGAGCYNAVPLQAQAQALLLAAPGCSQLRPRPSLSAPSSVCCLTCRCCPADLVQ